MGQDATATLSEIEAARQRLQRDIDELDRRAHPESDLRERAREVGIAVAAGTAGVVVVVGLTRRGLHRRAEIRRARLQAEVLADVLEERRAVVQGRGTDEDLAADAAATSAAALVAALAALVGTVVQFATRPRPG